jgi:regulator of Ty1 transposition protein 103
MVASVEKALESVDNTLEKIKQFTRTALGNDPTKVVALWREELSRRLLIGQDALPLVYCCNDILQESKGHESESYKAAYSQILEDDLRAILREKPESLELVRKVLTVWSERQVFDKDYMKKLKRCLHDFREGKLSNL